MKSHVNGWPLRWRQRNRGEVRPTRRTAPLGGAPTSQTLSAAQRARVAARKVHRSYTVMVGAAMLLAFVFNIGAVVTTPAPQPVAAQVCIPGIPGCIPDSPDDVVNPILDPVIDGLADAALGMLSGTLDRVAVDILGAAVGALDLVWIGFSSATTPNLEVVNGLHELMTVLGGSLLVLMYVTALLPAIAKGDAALGVQATGRMVIAAGGIAATRPILERVIQAVDVVSATVVFDANDNLRGWVETGGLGLIGATGVLSWVWIMLAGIVWVIGAMGVIIALSAGLYGTYALFAVSPVFWALWANNATRSIGSNGFRKLSAFILFKFAIAVGLNVVTSIIAASTQTADPSTAVFTFIIGGLGFIAVAFSPIAVWQITGMDVGAAIIAGRQILTSPARPIGAAVATGAAIVTAGSAAPLINRLVSAPVMSTRRGGGSSGSNRTNDSPGPASPAPEPARPSSRRSEPEMKPEPPPANSTLSAEAVKQRRAAQN